MIGARDCILATGTVTVPGELGPGRLFACLCVQTYRSCFSLALSFTRYPLEDRVRQSRNMLYGKKQISPAYNPASSNAEEEEAPHSSTTRERGVLLLQ